LYKNVNDVEHLLAQPYSGPTKEKDGFTYIPASESQKQLDRIFGPLGWSETDPVIAMDPTRGIYVAAERIVVRVEDENGGEREIGRVGFGRSTAQATKDEREQGLTVTKSLQLHDTAAAAAGTDAFSRACKKFGPAFGADLYGGTKRPKTSGGELGPRPSDKQLPWLHKAGLEDEQIAAMPFKEWKAALDAFFAKPKDSDDLPF
jgi:hypothetical protein